MRIMGMIAVATVALTGLSGCGKGSEFDKAFKEEGRKKFVEECVAEANKQIPAGVEVDVAGLCGCAADKTFTEDKGAMDIVKSAADQQAQMANMQECMKEAGMPVSGAAPAETAGATAE